MTEFPPAHPGVHYPPPLLFAVPFALGLMLGRWQRLTIVPPDSATAIRIVEIVGMLLVIIWAALMASAFERFLRARTAILPFRPATALVTNGPYRFSRNPMYVSMAVLYAGGALLLNAVWPLLLLPFVLVLVDRAVIQREERYLSHAFGTEYAAYRERVRRWV